MTDEQIIDELQQGRSDSFKELIRRYENRIASTVMGMLGRCPEAEDVGQETFIRFYRNVHNFRREASVITYLTRIAINLSLNELRSRNRKSLLFLQPRREDDLNPDMGQPPDETGDTREIVEKALHTLDTKFRAVVVLRLIEGYSTEETANLLKIPTGTVLSRLARAQKKLKTSLTSYIEEQS